MGAHIRKCILCNTECSCPGEIGNDIQLRDESSNLIKKFSLLLFNEGTARLCLPELHVGTTHQNSVVRCRSNIKIWLVRSPENCLMQRYGYRKWFAYEGVGADKIGYLVIKIRQCLIPGGKD